jgi:hypothetical protein
MRRRPSGLPRESSRRPGGGGPFSSRSLEDQHPNAKPHALEGDECTLQQPHCTGSAATTPSAGRVSLSSSSQPAHSRRAVTPAARRGGGCVELVGEHLDALVDLVAERANLMDALLGRGEARDVTRSSAAPRARHERTGGRRASAPTLGRRPSLRSAGRPPGLTTTRGRRRATATPARETFEPPRRADDRIGAGRRNGGGEPRNPAVSVRPCGPRPVVGTAGPRVARARSRQAAYPTTVQQQPPATTRGSS